jgi:hypothetical protein
MEYKIRELSWFKRREPTPMPQPVRVECYDMELVHNSYCKMAVRYDDEKNFMFDGHVCLNEIHNMSGTVQNQTWTVHGFNSKSGRQCLIEILK